MTSHLEALEVLEAVVARLSEVSDYIAAIPEGQKAIALDAVERNFLTTARNLGCADEPARLWVSAVMFQIRNQMERTNESAQTRVVTDRPPANFNLAEKCLTRATAALALVIVSPLIAFVWIGLKLEGPGPAIGLRRTRRGSPKAYSFVLGSGPISRFVRRADLQILPTLWQLLNGDNVLSLKDFSAILKFWKTSPSYR